MHRQWKRILSIVLTLPVVVATGACTKLSWSGPDSNSSRTWVPIVITVARAGVLLVPAPGQPIARLGVTVAASIAQDWAKQRDGTYLIIAQTVGGKYQATVFRVHSDRRLRIDMDGRFVQEVRKNQITITVPPDAESTIVVSDADSGDALYREGEFLLIGFNGNVGIDLDTGRLANPKTDPEFARSADIVTQRFGQLTPQLTNGASIARWAEGQPTLGECASTPKQQWEKNFNSIWWALTPRFCLRTSDGRYGFLKRDLTSVTFSYLLWAELSGTGASRTG